MRSEFQNVGFIGLGAMGKFMAEQLAMKLPESARIYVYDVINSAIIDLTTKFPGRVIGAISPKDVAQTSEIIISMVPEGAHIRSVYLDEKLGICSIDLQRRILIDCSTIDISTSLAVKQHIAKYHPEASFFDAPVSGGTLGAQKGTIAFFLGCKHDEPLMKPISKLLALMGNNIIPCGGPATGLGAKLCNNYLSGLIAIASSEALNIGIRAGLDPRVLSSVFAAGTAQNAICDRFNPCPGVVPEAPSSKGYDGGFKVQLMKKDFSLAVDLAQSVGATLALGAKGLETYDAAADDPRCRNLDSRVVFRYLGGQEDWAERSHI
ncbi:NAD binding domain of 6-phosphogluconate dehydrogenase-domain-containing protein [Aspergillus caelatus]|uniref:3-hydroxyisobutyrate dehydrogenase n=1 Tax=Aspergillus caelatus TaxID=61420 RepID=A0A5N7AG16_9EURO|nr:NAD binding domain of 6-phosphogluconate dehydrogenase-domain-containing protein [Aspergillus caelatus]KAE8368116.1 NAD binding domain of 6-phosphogluconate dehydrogenase-domain-containing protein [Aspergillus caelatus]